MTIEIRVVKDTRPFSQPEYCPVFICDHCHHPIAKAQDGAYVYGAKFNPPHDSFTPIKFFHKEGACKEAWDLFELQLDQNEWHPQWDELDDFVVCLANNLPGRPERKKRLK